MKSELFNFTSAKLTKLKNETGKAIEYADTTQRGLILRHTKKGVKTFRLRLWDKNKQKIIQMVIGHFPEVPIADAREIVLKRHSDIVNGVDVIDRQNKMRGELILDEAYQVWLETHAKPNCKRWKEEQRRYTLYIEPHLGNKRLSEITPDVITIWKIKLSKQKKEKRTGTLSPGMVHRIHIVLSSIFSKGAKNIPNPCSQVAKYQGEARTEFLGPEHLKLFFKQIDNDATPQWLRDYLLLSIYTGARQATILSMQWCQVDLDLKIWIIPPTTAKNKKSQTLPLMDKVVEILRARKRGVESAIFVFPSPHPRGNKTGHLTEPKGAWKKFKKNAGLPEHYIMHDLRRTHGSWQAMSGVSTKIIGATLGHKTEKATESYAHLLLGPIREAMEKANTAMDAAGK